MGKTDTREARHKRHHRVRLKVSGTASRPRLSIFRSLNHIYAQVIDDSQASATLTDGTTTVKLLFQFDAQGLISSVRSEGRAREVDGGQVITPWQGRFWDYQLRDGLLIPLEGEVAWLVQEELKPYWRGRIQRIEYEYAQ